MSSSGREVTRIQRFTRNLIIHEDSLPASRRRINRQRFGSPFSSNALIIIETCATINLETVAPFPRGFEAEASF
jgi:hypothetical protein